MCHRLRLDTGPRLGFAHQEAPLILDTMGGRGAVAAFLSLSLCLSLSLSPSLHFSPVVVNVGFNLTLSLSHCPSGEFVQDLIPGRGFSGPVILAYYVAQRLRVRQDRCMSPGQIRSQD